MFGIVRVRYEDGWRQLPVRGESALAPRATLDALQIHYGLAMLIRDPTAPNMSLERIDDHRHYERAHWMLCCAALAAGVFWPESTSWRHQAKQMIQHRDLTFGTDFPQGLPPGRPCGASTTRRLLSKRPAPRRQAWNTDDLASFLLFSRKTGIDPQSSLVLAASFGNYCNFPAWNLQPRVKGKHLRAIFEYLHHFMSTFSFDI